MIDNCTGRISPAGAADEFTKLGEKNAAYLCKLRRKYCTKRQIRVSLMRGAAHIILTDHFCFLKRIFFGGEFSLQSDQLLIIETG